jgi:hypothetical protein
MKPYRVSLAVCLALGLSTVLILVLAAGCGPSAQANGLELTYYYRPGCAVCAKAEPAVAGLEREFPGVHVHRIDATSPEGARTIERLDLEGHGLVIRSPRGFVLWKQPQHDINMDEVRAQLKALLSAQQQQQQARL